MKDNKAEIIETIQKSMELLKCRKCGCMKKSLESMKHALSDTENKDYSVLRNAIQNALDLTEPSEYTWIGCKPCWSAVVTNTFDKVFSDLKNFHSIENNIVNTHLLPAAGEYHVLSLDYASSIAVSTLSNSKLSETLALLKPKGLSIVGKTETENIGVEKIIKNVLAVPSIKYLILCGKDSEGHYSGNTLLKLIENGVDNKNKVIDSKGRKPVLINTTAEEIELFRKKIIAIDMIGCENTNEILDKIEYLSNKIPPIHESIQMEFTKNECLNLNSIETVTAKEKNPYNVKLDKEGYFVIMPEYNKKTIIVEHYGNNNQLLHIIQGENARNIYWTIIENNWISELSHAAYLGKELTLAEMSIKSGNDYVQDKA